MKGFRFWVLGVVTATMLSGCFTTKVYSRATPVGPPVEERQWFALGGLVELSPAAGTECASVAMAESKLAGMDIVIDVGLSIAGALMAPTLCATGDTSCRTNYGLVGSLLPWAIGTRTVRYQCAAGVAGEKRGR